MPRLTIFWLLHLVAAAVFVGGCALNAAIWLQGSLDGRPRPGLWAALAAGWRFLRRVGLRRSLRALLVDGLVHRRLLALDRWRWLAHTCLLGGFFAMFALSTLTGFCQEVLVALFNVRHPLVMAIVDKDTPIMALANETLGLVMLAGMALVIARRYLRRPAQLRTGAPDTLLVALLSVTLVSGYPVEVLRLLEDQVPPALGWYSYIAYPLSLSLRGLHAPWGTLHDWVFLFHSTLASVFFAYVPLSKFFHVLVSPLVAMAGAAGGGGGSGTPAPIAPAPAPPVAAPSRLKLAGYTVGQLMALDACTRCGECVAWCPTFAENRHELTHPLGKIACLRSWARGQYGLRARLAGPRPPGDGELATFSAGVYACTLCARCREVCPVQIDTRPLWLAMREHLVELGTYPPALATLREHVAARHNMAGEDNAQRLAWSANLPEELGTLAGRPAEVVYFVGCVAALYPQAYSIPQSLAQVFRRVGVDFATLGGEEWCCGFPLLIAGMGAEARSLARHNVEAVRALGAKTLVASCPSCYHTWRHDYPRLLGEPLGFEVQHASQALAALLDEGRLKLGPYERPLTYHDPCDLGRTSGIYEAPRRLLRAMPGARLAEMKDHHALALCCGGGGDVEMADAGLAAAVASRRLAQAQETGAEVLVSACQQCKRTLAGAARREKARLRVLDITEVVWASMQSA